MGMVSRSRQICFVGIFVDFFVVVFLLLSSMVINQISGEDWISWYGDMRGHRIITDVSRVERSSNGSFRTMREIYLSNENVTERQIYTRPYNNSIVNTCVNVEDRHRFPRKKRHRCSLRLSIQFVSSVRIARYMVQRYKLCYFPYYDSIIIFVSIPFYAGDVANMAQCLQSHAPTRRVSEWVHDGFIGIHCIRFGAENMTTTAIVGRHRRCSTIVFDCKGRLKCPTRQTEL